MSSSETHVIEWGCPVSENVRAHSRSEAIQKIGKECMEEARQAAHQKADVFDVIKTSLIWPDVEVSESNKGYHLNGTFFLETLVLERSGRLTPSAR
jgi:hypothetical protein